MNKQNNRSPNTSSTRKTWRKPVLVEHGDLVTLTRGKTPGGTDSGLGTPS